MNNTHNNFAIALALVCIIIGSTTHSMIIRGEAAIYVGARPNSQRLKKVFEVGSNILGALPDVVANFKDDDALPPQTIENPPPTLFAKICHSVSLGIQQCHTWGINNLTAHQMDWYNDAYPVYQYCCNVVIRGYPNCHLLAVPPPTPLNNCGHNSSGGTSGDSSKRNPLLGNGWLFIFLVLIMSMVV